MASDVRLGSFVPCHLPPNTSQTYHARTTTRLASWSSHRDLRLGVHLRLSAVDGWRWPVLTAQVELFVRSVMDCADPQADYSDSQE